ncbi:MAG: hypothetical protein IAE78_27595, partial [Myxococcus sp.]|nr:hypothetical protein [Myxococcus sp.]
MRVALLAVPTQYGVLAQHGRLELAQAAPLPRHVGATPQVPDRQESPVQHWLDEEHDWPEPLHVGPLAQNPLLHERPRQHGDDD